MHTFMKVSVCVHTSAHKQKHTLKHVNHTPLDDVVNPDRPVVLHDRYERFDKLRPSYTNETNILDEVQK